MGYDFDFALVLKFLPFILKGLVFTLLVSVGAFVLGLVLGILVAVLRLTGNRFLNPILSLYVDIFRSLPHLVALFWFFYAVPILTGFQPSAVLSAVIALGVIASANVSELFRSGILSIPSSQWQVAYAMGMTTLQVYQRIIVPQAVVKILPPLGSFAISIIKASALASIIGVADLTWQGNAMTMWTFRRVEVFTVIAVVYFVITYPLAFLVNRFHEKLSVAGPSSF